MIKFQSINLFLPLLPSEVSQKIAELRQLIQAGEAALKLVIEALATRDRLLLLLSQNIVDWKKLMYVKPTLKKPVLPKQNS